MTIAPIIHKVQVKAPPARAFELFATRFDAWWPKGNTIGQKPFVAIVIEPRTGGQWFERDAEGKETCWGKVLAWEPPGRLLLGWQINMQWAYDPEFLTEVELTFVPAEGGGTVVTLEHRNLERFGTDAVAHAGKLNGGWGTYLGLFGHYVDDNA